ncbi:hypothetical protein FRB96_007187 [Tulasnella sp. 330]|nr:hypothetical protein FRB96_007187 [Tulasnella sp. 330]
MHSAPLFIFVSATLVYFMPAVVAAPLPTFDRSSSSHTLNTRGVPEAINVFPTFMIKKLAIQKRPTDPSAWGKVIAIAESNPSSKLGKSQKKQAMKLLEKYRKEAVQRVGTVNANAASTSPPWTEHIVKYFAGNRDAKGAEAKEALAVQKLSFYDVDSPPTDEDVLLAEKARAKDVAREEAGGHAVTSANESLKHWALSKHIMDMTAATDQSKLSDSAKRIQGIKDFHLGQGTGEKSEAELRAEDNEHYAPLLQAIRANDKKTA